jgi:hypothetical protein
MPEPFVRVHHQEQEASDEAVGALLLGMLAVAVVYVVSRLV